MPFLEILTRCYKRPRMLAINQASLTTQTDPDWVQTLLPDLIGRGIGWSMENMANYASELVGDYIWILDDDDMCICPTLVADLKSIWVSSGPDVIMVKMDHEGVILPGERTWGHAPVYGQIGVSAFIVKREVWQANCRAFIPGWYGSDFSFINEIWGNNPQFDMAMWITPPKIYWFDCVASRMQRHSLGKEESVEPTLDVSRS